MRIPDQLLKNVVFVSRDEENLRFAGTAFIVLTPDDDGHGFLHLVTAKHVAKQLIDGSATIVCNGRDGLPLFMKNQSLVNWFFHPNDETVDVAVLPMATARLAEYDYQEIVTDRFATEERMRDYGLGIGDETFTIGLYTPFPGRQKLAPIAKAGVIAMMSERIPHPTFGSMEVILIESRSLSGMSGSPVFARSTGTLMTTRQDGSLAPFSVGGEFHLLGLMSGHVQGSLDPQSPTSNPINIGMSLVVPAAKILEVLSCKELLALREARRRAIATEADTSTA